MRETEKPLYARSITTYGPHSLITFSVMLATPVPLSKTPYYVVLDAGGPSPPYRPHSVGPTGWFYLSWGPRPHTPSTSLETTPQYQWGTYADPYGSDHAYLLTR